MFALSTEERKIYEHMPIALAIYVMDRQSRVICLCISDGMCTFCQRSRKDLVQLLNEAMFSLVHPSDAGMLAQLGRQFALHASGYDVIYRLKTWTSDSAYHYVHTIGQWLRHEDGSEAAILVYSNMNETVTANQDIMKRYQSWQRDYFYTDILTGLPNANFMRAFGDEKLAQCFLETGGAAGWYFDVNGMHAYNSRYGLQCGDRLLMAVGSALSHAFPDGLVCRSTDDHFVVIAPFHKDKIDALMQQINAQVQNDVDGVSLGVRTGVCLAKPHMPVMELLDDAHTGLKEIGTNLNVTWHLYSPDVDQKMMLAHYLVTHFNQALQEHWVHPYYQPIIDVQTGKIAEAEALARWIDPVQGPLKPVQFIPALRSFHLLYRLDLYILQEVCRHLQEQIQKGEPAVPVSVNFSRQDFDNEDLVQQMHKIIAACGIDASLIRIEITEQDVSEAPDCMKKQIEAIHRRGYALWMDDFGSGYSSLNVMSEFPFDLIKFDQKMLMNLDAGHGANRYIMDAMTSIARKLGIHTLAEGVEKQSDLRFLQEIHCQYAQGFLFYKPMKSEDFDALLKGQK